MDEVLDRTNQINFCVCFLPLSSLKKMGKLVSHEQFRNKGQLRMLDTYDEVINFVQANPTAFFSHQWLTADEPDPANQHFDAMLDAAAALCKQESIDPDKLYVWLDFSSIPQLNDHLKMASIASIALYASVCRYFIGVCPSLKNKSGVCYDVSTYQKRGWVRATGSNQMLASTASVPSQSHLLAAESRVPSSQCRLEQWARLTVGGLEKMFIYDGTLKNLSDNPAWYRDSIRVFNGDFTVDTDKQKLVPTILSLWATVLHNFHMGNDVVGSYELVKAHYTDVFPPEQFGALLGLLEARIAGQYPDDHETSTASSFLNMFITGSKAGKVAPSQVTRTSTRSLFKRSDGALFKAFKAPVTRLDPMRQHASHPPHPAQRASPARRPRRARRSVTSPRRARRTGRRMVRARSVLTERRGASRARARLRRPMSRVLLRLATFVPRCPTFEAQAAHRGTHAF